MFQGIGLMDVKVVTVVLTKVMKILPSFKETVKKIFLSFFTGCVETLPLTV